jgi:alkylation response protein AidB-like acyl-CoA dehydrogenase
MSAATSKATTETFFAAVREVEPLIRAHAAEAERERRLPDPVAHALRERGFYRMWRPRAFGGLEIDPMTGCRVFEELARIDSAAGWNVQIACAWDPLGAWFSDQGAQEAFGDPDTVLAGAGFPPRRATPVDGGYRVTGQQPFLSGAHQSAWFIGLAHVFDGDSPRLGETGDPVMLATVCPAAKAAIVDTWRTLGMRGTGSHDVAMNDVFVPERHTAVLAPLENPGSAYQGPLYRFSIWSAVAAIAPVATGIARAAIDDLLALAGGKTPSYTAKALRDRGVVQSQIAQAEARLGAARAYLYQSLEEAWDEAVQGRRIDMPHKLRVQLAATHAVHAAAEAVDLVHAAAGTTAIRDEHRFQRHFRDVHTITQHGFIAASRYESAGQVMLGLPPEWPFFAL